MEWFLYRKEFYPDCTQGEFFIGKTFFAHVLEDCDRGLNDLMPLSEINKIKQYGITAIPYGRYRVVVTYSPKFKREMCLLLGVKGFVGIRIHGGNTAEHSLGCLLVARNKAYKRIQGSMEAEITAIAKTTKEDIYINILKA